MWNRLPAGLVSRRISMCSAIQPSLARHVRGDAQRQALLAQQGVAAVAGPVRPDQVLFGKVGDVLLFQRRTRPGHVVLDPGASGAPTECRQGMNSPLSPSASQHLVADPRHDVHVHDDVGRVGDLDADLAKSANRSVPSRRGSRTSCGPACSRGTAPSWSASARPGRSSCWSGRRLPGCCAGDVSAVLDARHVAGVAAEQVAVGTLLVRQLGGHAAVDHRSASGDRIRPASRRPTRPCPVGKELALQTPIRAVSCYSFSRSWLSLLVVPAARSASDRRGGPWPLGVVST